MRSMFFPAVMTCGMALSTIHPAHADGFGYQTDTPNYSGFDYQAPPPVIETPRYDYTQPVPQEYYPNDNN
jgi:hypothetical protein